MKIRTFLVIFILSFIFFVILTPLRSSAFGGFPVSSLVGFVVMTYVTMFCLNRYKEKLSSGVIIVALLAGHSLVELPTRIIDFQGPLVSFPDFVVRTLGIVCGAIYWQTKAPLNLATLALLCTVPVFMYFQGYNYWLQKLNYGTFTGNVSYSQPTYFEAFTKNGKVINDSDLENKIVLLDFWNTTCGVCFMKFPYVEELQAKYKDDPNVMIMAVNAPLEGDKPGQAFQMIEERGYTFPVVITKDEQMAERFGVFTYPKTFIIANNRTVVFYGDIWLAANKIEQLRSSLR